MSVSLIKFASVEEALSKELSGLWLYVRFRRATNRKGFVLMNLPICFVQAVCTKLFLQGCKLLSDPVLDESEQFVSIHFSANSQVAGILALLFPCPAPGDQLIISERGFLLNGMAAKLVTEPYLQEVAGRVLEA